MTVRARSLALATAVGLIYILTGKLGLDYAYLHASATPVWPPAGIALAAFLIRGVGLWPVIFVGAFLINISTAGSVATSLAIALGNTLEAVLGAILVNRYAGGRNALDRVRYIFLFAVLAGFLSTAVSATIGVTSLALGGFARWSDYGSIWLTWWLGDAAGDLVVAPLILLWSRQLGLGALRTRWAEALLLGATVLGVGLLVFGGILPAPMRNMPIAFLCIPPLLWTAIRFGQREAATAIAVLSAVAVSGTVRGVGPFAIGPANESLLLLQGFMATLAVSLLPVGAGVMHQRRAESAVRESEKGLRLAVAAGQMGTWDWSIPTGQVTWSPELEAIHGLARGAFAGTLAAFQADIHPEDRGLVEQTIRESLAGGTHRLEYRIVRPDGEIRWLEARGEVSYDEAGQPHRLRGICMDITSRKAAEAERERLLAQEREARARAEEVERRLAFMGEIARSITASLDVTTVLQRIAEGTRALCRSDSAAIFLREGETLRPRYRVGPWPEIYRTLRIRPGESIGGEVMLTGKPTRSDDYTRDPRVPPSHAVIAEQTGTVSVMVVPIVIRTQVAGLLYVSNHTRRPFTDEDETVSSQLAEQAAIAIQNAELFAREAVARQGAEAANSAKDEFLAMLGHELRNPLGAISNAAHVLGMAQDAGPLVDRVHGIISRQVVQLGRVVDDLLDVSRVTSGKIALDRKPLDLAELARRVAALVGATAHTLSVEAAEVWVDADPARLEQVVVNLLDNAVKYTPAGGEICVLVASEGGDAVLSVRDSGVGIAAELLPRVFDLFVQGDHSLDRSRGGLGIGLTLVRRLVEKHGGAVTAASEGAGKGTIFTVRLPAIARPLESRPPARPPRPAAARRVLLVEDNADSRQMLRDLIHLLGHEVHEAGDGVTGLDLALKLEPDLALVDVGLPGMDGYEVARRLRAHPGGRRLRLVAVTGYGLPEDRERAYAAGFDLHLVKPVDPARIAELLADA